MKLKILATITTTVEYEQDEDGGCNNTKLLDHDWDRLDDDHDMHHPVECLGCGEEIAEPYGGEEEDALFEFIVEE